jgi:hypothetical protein
MGYIQEYFNFDNIGTKIKTLTKWSCWISILLLWIATPILIVVAIIEGGDEAILAIILFPLMALISSIIVWISSWAMYAFGEFVEDIHAMRAETKAKKEDPVTDTSVLFSAEKPSVVVAEPVIKKETLPNTWTCSHCSTQNSANYSQCKKCGKTRGA